MRRAYITLMMIIIGILVMVSAGSSLAANQQGDQAALAGSVSTAAKGLADGKTKSPPPGDTGKTGPADPNYRPSACLETVVNVSATTGNHAESHIVINPTNPQNLVAFSNVTSNSTFRAYSTNGGATWTRGNILPGIACCDAQAVFDRFGNLFMVYINGSVNQINVIASTDGGATFSTPLTVGSGSIDQPSIAVGTDSVWVDWNQSGSMKVRGAPITGLGTWGPFNALQTPPSATGSFGGIAVGPNNVPIITYQNPTGGEGPATIFANVDADGLGAGNFGPQILVSTTNVGGFDFIPAQSGRSIDAEAGVVWDYTGGTFNGRIYLVYTEEPIAENNDTEIYVRTSTNSGTTWSAPVRVNDDPTGVIRSQFLPYITLDRSTGTVAVGFHDARNDNGVPGSGGTNAIVNDDSEYYATYTTDGGATWAVNKRLSGGFSNDNAAGNGVDYGDYVGQDAYGGKFVGMWADNANCDGTNPDGTLHAFDLYMGIMQLPTGGTPTPTTTGTVPTATPTRTSTSTPLPTNTPVPTATPCAIIFNEGFESGTLGAFTNVVPTCVPGGCNWTSVASNPHTGTRSAFAPDGGNISDQYLQQTTGIVVTAGSSLTFWHRYDTEPTFDGGVLEATTNNGSTWVDMEANIVSGGYDGPISSNFNSPIAGRNAWNGSHTTYSQVVVNLAPYVGQTLRVRFRLATDSSVSAVGWNVDDVVFLGGTCTTVTPSTATATATSTPVVPTGTATNTPV
ncbi:MAG: hypothetical protein ABIQ44_09140, partial [Chloroflexia bacterium]